jgi:two-component system sensor histidine kinase KdpD
MKPAGVPGRYRTIRAAKPYLILIAAHLALTATTVALRPSLGLATVTLVYLLFVFLCAVRWGRGPSLVASLFAFLTVNFFFTVPYATLAVASMQDFTTLLVFLVVAEVTSRLVAELREREADSRRKAWEASTLHALSDAVSAATRPGEILRTVASRIVKVLGVRECAIFLPDGEGRLHLHTAVPPEKRQALEAEGVPGSVVGAFTERKPIEQDHALSLPLTVGEKTVGVMHVGPLEGSTRLPEATERLLRTFSGQAAVVIERLRLHHEAAEAEILRRTDELKSELLAAVSHDLRTPLTSIRVAATALQDDARCGENARRELLEMIDAEAARLSRLVGNLLDLSRIQAGALRPLKEWRDLHEVVGRAVDSLHDRLRDHRVLVAIPEDLPFVPLDFTEIEDVLGNLLDNAVRHAPEGTEIRITARHQRDEVVVQVENDGPPIPVKEAGQIFNRFCTGDTSGRRTGLGLATCKGLIEAHGGRIWIERPGEPGARFAFALPLGEMMATVGEKPPGGTR